MSELKPCPKCQSNDVGASQGKAYCYKCGLTTKQHVTNELAVDDWNTRTESPQLEQVTKERDELKAFAQSVASANVQHEKISGPYGGVDEWSFICDSYKDRAVALLAKLNQ